MSDREIWGIFRREFFQRCLVYIATRSSSLPIQSVLKTLTSFLDSVNTSDLWSLLLIFDLWSPTLPNLPPVISLSVLLNKVCRLFDPSDLLSFLLSSTTQMSNWPIKTSSFLLEPCEEPVNSSQAFTLFDQDSINYRSGTNDERCLSEMPINLYRNGDLKRMNEVKRPLRKLMLSGFDYSMHILWLLFILFTSSNLFAVWCAFGVEFEVISRSMETMNQKMGAKWPIWRRINRIGMRIDTTEISEPRSRLELND